MGQGGEVDPKSENFRRDWPRAAHEEALRMVGAGVCKLEGPGGGQSLSMFRIPESILLGSKRSVALSFNFVTTK